MVKPTAAALRLIDQNFDAPDAFEPQISLGELPQIFNRWSSPISALAHDIPRCFLSWQYSRNVIEKVKKQDTLALLN